ncbi:uncharacterized protein KY384_006701 [Bacidia gigantensis]|uniref:uncharacterized protein n=1 Tax=Bacidia gigantensis TaxID=2732470 RepID=UPI001D0380B1|nr:uncharacterized protein KY384_006701 [Bacidia gigantensis]KAG8529012.1 hypothetical protein KY384_006701 [Bacidia gigantensis]
MDTCWFNPTKQYIADSVLDPGVQTYIKENKRRRPVYMITGLMIARGASASKKSMVDKGLHAQFGVDFSAIGVPAALGPKIEVASGKEQTIHFDHATDFVLAYRLKKIKVKAKGAIKSKPYNTGALFDSDVKESALPVDTSWDIDDIEAEDVTADLLDGGSTSHVARFDEECELVALK